MSIRKPEVALAVFLFVVALAAQMAAIGFYWQDRFGAGLLGNLVGGVLAVGSGRTLNRAVTGGRR